MRSPFNRADARLKGLFNLKKRGTLMFTKKYIIVMDQRSNASRAIIINTEGKIVGVTERKIHKISPQPGWVEHDPMEIWGAQMGSVKEVMERNGVRPSEVAAIGITNQRETTVVWDKDTGKPIYNAISWQCNRTADMCKDLRSKGLSSSIKAKTGLVIDVAFSATKLKWILDSIPGAKEKAKKGQLLFGNIDTWLIWKLTEGKVHVTDYSNASKTMLFNIHTLDWDDQILEQLDIPKAMLPEVASSSQVYANTTLEVFGAEVPVAGDIGDQQAALFGLGCFEPGMAKNTYGTGCFILMNTGDKAVKTDKGLLTTIAWGLDDKICYALEGSILSGGAVLEWLRDDFRVINDEIGSSQLANKVEDTNGVYFVPAFSGLGAPYWDAYARGTIVGLTRGTNREHIVRAALESIAYQTKDVIEVMQKESDISLNELRVDGQYVSNDFLLQFQSDILAVPVARTKFLETSAFGAAYLAGLAVGFWKDRDEILEKWQQDKLFKPSMDEKMRDAYYKNWKKAVTKSFSWEERSL